MSSRCAASSSIACTGSEGAPVFAACVRTRAFQSCCIYPLRVLDAGDLGQRRDEAAPVGALLHEYAPPRVGNPVIAAAALAGLFHPPALDPAAIFEAIKRRVERGERELQAAAGPLLDQLGDLVAVMALVFDDGENHDLGAAFLGFVERASA